MKTLVTTGLVALVTLAGGQARAQEQAPAERRLAAPTEAFELGLSTGYAQPFGQLMGGTGMPSVASAGVSVELDLAYRLPHWSFGAGVQYQTFTPERGKATRGGTGTFIAAYHFQPNQRLDPWLELGVGYRLLWEIPTVEQQNSILTHGIELARVRAGLDFRGNAVAAIAPVIGADATLFLWQDVTTSTAISDPRISTFVFAGVQGRLDLGSAPSSTTATAKR